jgi:hypothetical protein
MAAADRPALSPSAEIANLEHELGVLRGRHASILVNERRIEATFVYGAWATVAVAIGLVIYALATGNIFGAVIVIIIVAILGIGWLMELKGWDFDNVRYPLRPDRWRLEQAIALREKRLNELKEQEALPWSRSS